MKESIYKNYDELPLFLNAATVAKVLGIAPSSSYELMHEKDFRKKRLSAGWSSTREELSEAKSLADTRFGQGLLPTAEGDFLAGSERSGNRDLRLPAVLRGSPDVPMLAELPENR